MNGFWFSFDGSTGLNLIIGPTGEVGQSKPLREWYRLALPVSNPCPCCKGTGSADLPVPTEAEMMGTLRAEIRALEHRLDRISTQHLGGIWQNGKRVR